MSRQLDILCVGDTTIDAFIRLKDAKVHCSIDNENCELCVRFGDKIPYESVTVIPAVGNAANAAVSAARLGLSSGFLAWVGDDVHGKECIAALKKEGVDTSHMTREPRKTTNYHYVLWYETERTILVKHEEYSYEWPRLKKQPRFIYLSSIAENAIPFQKALAKYLWENPEVQLAFQPGTFQMKVGTTELVEVYKNTYIFFCNKEEAQRILKSMETDPKKLLESIRRLGPKVAVMTDGRNGAYAQDERTTYFTPMYPDTRPPLERTGAGDAFASTVVAALALGEPLERALAWGPINSMSVVQEIGAQKGLLPREKLETLLAGAPAEYRVKKI